MIALRQPADEQGGFAIEAAIVAMRQSGCSTFFIDDSGDLWMEGTKPDGSPWRRS